MEDGACDGGAMGLGAEVAKRLAQEGARVLVVDIDADKGQQLGSQVGGREPPSPKSPT
jgi:NAD(P)-dependent dehydrogenase (short-subunit alcohol dehydrogenase family)